MYLRCNTQIVSFLSDSKYIKRVTRKWWSMEKKHWRRIVIAQEKQFHATWVCLGLNLLKCCLWLSCNWRWKQKRSTWNKTREFHILKLNVEMHHWAACHMLSYLFLSTQPPKFPHQTHDSQVCKTRHHKRFCESSNQQEDATWISHQHTFYVTEKPIRAADSYHVNNLFSKYYEIATVIASKTIFWNYYDYNVAC